jgi:hypothetical protein
VHYFPLKYNWQIIALGIMGIVVMALIPQQIARTAIISQMLINLSESLGYKNPSKASTGCCEFSRSRTIGLSVPYRIDDELDRVGTFACGSARAVHLGLLVPGRVGADIDRYGNYCVRDHVSLST